MKLPPAPGLYNFKDLNSASNLQSNHFLEDVASDSVKLRVEGDVPQTERAPLNTTQMVPMSPSVQMQQSPAASMHRDTFPVFKPHQNLIF